jgi:hypothetical protein
MIVAMMVIAMLSVTPGCAQNETNRAAQGMITVQLYANHTYDALRAGQITVEQAKARRVWLQKGREATVAYYDAIQAGDDAALAAAKAALEVARLELLKFPLTPVELPPLPQPTTQP